MVDGGRLKEAPRPSLRELPRLAWSQQDPVKTTREAWRRFGDVFYLPGRGGGIFFIHPDHVQRILLDRQAFYLKQTREYEKLRLILGDGLLTSDGEAWRRQRQMIQPIFHHENVCRFAGLITRATEEMLDRWEERRSSGFPLDLSVEMGQLTLTIIGQAMFSADLGQEETSRVCRSILETNRHLRSDITRLFELPHWVPTPRNWRFRASRRIFHALIGRMIQDRLRNGQEGREDLLSLLLVARDPETGQPLDSKQVEDEINTFYAAGHETTANALTWTWYLLSQHPPVLDLLRQELEFLGGRPPTLKDLPRLSYTRQVIQESLRLYPPVWLLPRLATQEDSIGGYRVPAGAKVCVSLYCTHRHPRFWEQPEIFDPTRFDPDRQGSRHPFAYFPFSGGPRSCVGRDLALLETTLILATTAQRYRLQRVPTHPVRTEALITLRPRYGMKMTVHRH